MSKNAIKTATAPVPGEVTETENNAAVETPAAPPAPAPLSEIARISAEVKKMRDQAAADLKAGKPLNEIPYKNNIDNQLVVAVAGVSGVKYSKSPEGVMTVSAKNAKGEDQIIYSFTGNLDDGFKGTCFALEGSPAIKQWVAERLFKYITKGGASIKSGKSKGGSSDLAAAFGVAA